jgi:DNA-binding response OmpR family regulator
MRERQPGDRLRVVIAGNIYAKRALVRRFLEDDGFEVVGEALSADELFGLEALASADAIVIDGDLLGDGVEPLRGAAPDAAIVVFTGRTGAGVASPAGADGYLEKGMGLASLTALLHSLLSEAPVPPLGLAWSAPPPPPAVPTERRVLAGLAGIAAGIVLVAMVALAVFGGVGSTPIANPIAPHPSSSPPVASGGKTALDLANADLDRLQAALAAGRTVAAQAALQDLAAILSSAHPTFSTTGFMATAVDALQPLLGNVGDNLIQQLRSVFGNALRSPAGTSTSGGTVSAGTTSGATGGSTTGASGGGGGAATSSGGGSNGGGQGGGSGGHGQGGGPSSTPPGNGHHYGWAHKPPAGGWHGSKPHPNGHGRN